MRPRRDEVVRRQLAKGDKNEIRGIYNRAVYRSERVRLTQYAAHAAWATSCARGH